MEQCQSQAILLRPCGERGLRVMERQRCGQRPDLLGRVGVAEHDLDPLAIGGETFADGLEPQHLVQDFGRARKVVERLEQRHNIEHRDPAAGGMTRKLVDRCYVARPTRKADHVSAAALDAVR